MKKVLLGTSALIAAAAVSAPAMAQEQIQLGLGGKMEQYFGFNSFDDSATEELTGTGILTDTEVYFTGATTLDNGLTVGAVIQYEANTVTGTSHTDEQYAYIEGAFGQIQAGQKDGAGVQLAHIAPAVGLGQGDIDDWTGQSSQFSLAAVDTTWSSDDAAVTYITPSLGGFSAGVTFKPNPGSAGFANTVVDAEAGADVDGTDLHNQLQAAVAYNGEFSGVGIGADVAYRHQSGDEADLAVNEVEDEKAWRGGLVLSFAGFQAGGSYMRIDDVAGVDGVDRQVWDAGVAYETGPYGVSLTYANNSTETDGVAAEPEYQQVHLGASYTMGPGIDLVGAAYWAEFDSDTAADDNDGVGGIVGIELAF